MPRAKNDEAARRLATIPGLGVRNATALAAAIGGGQTFARGRDLAAWLGPNEVEPEQTWQTFQKLFAMVNHIDAESGIRRRRQPFRDLVLAAEFPTRLRASSMAPQTCSPAAYNHRGTDRDQRDHSQNPANDTKRLKSPIGGLQPRVKRHKPGDEGQQSKNRRGDGEGRYH
jgi:Transposase IS116/IS110/IS902 family